MLADFTELLRADLIAALTGRGFDDLTEVQKAVLAPDLAGRDLRISSQTGSGKTVAIGLALRELAEPLPPSAPGKAQPKALVITPTRELAKQVVTELEWLYRARRLRIAAVTGGASYRDELRALGRGPTFIVATPGRLLDHLNKGAIDASAIAAVVLDEADRMLDMGFREDLDSILEHTPEARRTHLVSATFPTEVKRLADRVQSDPVHVEGTRLGEANQDIDHVLHLVVPDERVAAIINLLLAHPSEQTLVFARTRADVSELSTQLRQAGFPVSALSGDLEQAERDRAMAAFRRGQHRVLVATDVAARGIDVQDIARVIHAEPPTDADTYTHRSGRTGRAGRKGKSSVLVTQRAYKRVSQILERAGIAFKHEPLPSAAEIRAQADDQLLQALTEDASTPDVRALSLAQRLTQHPHAEDIVARLLMRHRASGSEPRELTPQQLPRATARARERGGRTLEPRSNAWVSFRVSVGKAQGADARRLLAMLCRRGRIRGQEVGAIRIGDHESRFEVAQHVAQDFAQAVREPDPRNPMVRVVAEAPPRETAGPRAHQHDRPRASLRPSPQATAVARSPRNDGPAMPPRPSLEATGKPKKKKARWVSRPAVQPSQ